MTRSTTRNDWEASPFGHSVPIELDLTAILVCEKMLNLLFS